MNGQKRIETIWAYVATDPEDNTEGIISMQMGDQHFPLVGADPERIKALRPWAEATVKATGAKVTLVRFTTRTELDVLQ